MKTYLKKQKTYADIMAEIELAKEELKRWFPPPVEGDILSRGFKVEFPDVDRARVTQIVLGHEVEAASVDYRLSWDRPMLAWIPEGIKIRRELGLPNICRKVLVPRVRT